MLSQLLTTVTKNAKLAVAVTAGAAMIAGGSAVALTQVADSSPMAGPTVTAPLQKPVHAGRARADNEASLANALAESDATDSDTPTATISPKPSRSPDSDDNESAEPSKSPKAEDCHDGKTAPAVAGTACVQKADDGNDNDGDATESPKPGRTADPKDAVETGVSGRNAASHDGAADATHATEAPDAPDAAETPDATKAAEHSTVRTDQSGHDGSSSGRDAGRGTSDSGSGSDG